MKLFSLFSIVCLLAAQSCNSTNVEPEPTLNVLFPNLTGTDPAGKVWLVDSFSYGPAYLWQPASNLGCYADDRHTYRPDSVFRRETGPVVGECSGCNTCYYTGNWSYNTADSLLIQLNPSGGTPDSFKVYELSSNRMVRAIWGPEGARQMLSPL